MANEKSKSVKMSASKGNVKNPDQEKLSYEQLEQIAGNLNQQCRQMQQVINNQQQAIAEFNEIGMLLDVLGKSEHFSEKFVTRCSNKIEELITKAMDASEKQDEKEESKWAKTEKTLLETFKEKEHKARKWLLIDLDPKSNTGNGLIDQLNSV